MPKSTFNDCHRIYRETRPLSRAHKLTLIGWLQEDVTEKPGKVVRQKKDDKKSATTATPPA